MKLVIASLVTASLLTTPFASAIDPSVDPAVTAWIKQHAIPFKSSQAGNGFDDLAPLKKVVGDARIVALGEPTHGTREAFQMKHRLLEFLVDEMGFSIFSIEANMPEAYALNDYVIDGKGDPKRLIAGMYFWTWNTEEVLAMVEWMRQWNQSHPPETGKPRLQFTGFDMQTQTVAKRLTEEFLKQHDADYYKKVQPELDRLDAYSPFGAAGAGFGCATGKFPVEDARGKKIRFSGWIKSEEVSSWAGLWWRVDGPTPFFDNMSTRGLKGTTDWEERVIEVDVPADASAIYFGLVMPGEGKAWFDSLKVEIDGSPWSNPDFDLGFENLQPRGIIAADPMRGKPSPSYPGTLDEQVTHSGKSSFRLERVVRPGALEPAEAEVIAKGVLDHMTAARDEYLKNSDAKSVDWAIQNARVVYQWTGLATNEDGGGFGHRDACMADNAEWILAQNPGQKMVIWAHNGHVSRSTAYGTQWMGWHMEKKFPGQMVIFGFTTGAGQYTAMGGEDGKRGLRSDHELQAPTTGSVESFLAAAGEPLLFLDIRSTSKDDPATAWAATNAPMRSIGAMAMKQQFYPIVPKDLYDILVWQEKTTASVLLGR